MRTRRHAVPHGRGRKVRLTLIIGAVLCLLGASVVAAHTASALPNLGGDGGPAGTGGLGEGDGGTRPRPNPVPPVAEQPGAAPVASFDFTVPDGPKSDVDGNGIFDLPPARSVIHRDQFPVNLDGCASDGRGATITSYEWAVALPTGTVRADGPDCRTTVTAPAQGTYRVTLTVRTDNGGSATTTGSVTVRNYLIVSIGDSYAAGEGNPDIRAGGGKPIGTWRLDENPPTWTDKPCHRSWTSGPAIAAETIEKADPRTSVTFVSVACSGASIVNGLLGEYPDPPGREPGDKPLTNQIEQVRRLLCPQTDSRFCLGSPPARTADPLRIDVLMIGVGGNDVGFGNIIRNCAEIFIQGKECQLRRELQDQVTAGLADLPGRYRKLNDKLRSTLTFSHAYLPEYQNPLFNDAGQICSEMIFKDADDEYGSGIDGRISNAEAAWANHDVVQPLNQAVHVGARENDWTIVDGIADEGIPHGYCARDHWVNTYEESRWAFQGDRFGTLHPNKAGHEMYARHMARTITPDLPPVSRPTLSDGAGGCPGSGEIPEPGDPRGCR